jgi:hypothetical protein
MKTANSEDMSRKKMFYAISFGESFEIFARPLTKQSVKQD